MKWDVQATDEYERKLSKLGDEKLIRAIANKSIFNGAAIVANAIKASINGLTAVPDVENLKNWKQKKKSQLTIGQKQGLLEGLGIAKFKNTNGYINTKIGFNGYNSIRTKKYPQGQPNTLIARMVEGGGSTYEAQPFIRKAVTASKSAAVEAMGVTIDNEMKSLM